MDTPRATDLFLQLWAQGMADDEAAHPGTPAWTAEVQERWFRIWLDCQRFAQTIETTHEILDEVKAKRPKA